MKFSQWLLMTTLVVLTGVCQSCRNNTTGTPVTLKLNLAQGSMYKYHQTVDMTLEMIGNNSQQNSDYNFEYSVAGNEGTNHNLSVMFTKFATMMTSPLGKAAYNSDNDSATSFREPFNMIVSETGDIKAVNGLEQLQQKMIGVSGLDASVTSLLSGTFSDSAMQNIMRPVFSIYPEKTVRTGDTWHKMSTTNISGLSLKLDATYKLVRVKDGTANIDINTKIMSNGGSINTPGMEVKIDVTGTSKGSMKVDVATGILKEGNEEANIEGDMSGGGMKAPVNMVLKVKTTGEKIR